MCNNSGHSSALKTNKIAAKCFGINSVESWKIVHKCKNRYNLLLRFKFTMLKSFLCWKVLTRWVWTHRFTVSRTKLRIARNCWYVQGGIVIAVCLFQHTQYEDYHLLEAMSIIPVEKRNLEKALMPFSLDYQPYDPPLPPNAWYAKESFLEACFKGRTSMFENLLLFSLKNSLWIYEHINHISNLFKLIRFLKVLHNQFDIYE